MLIPLRGIFAGRGEIVVDLSIGEISLIFLINGLSHWWLIYYFFAPKGKECVGRHRVRLLIFFTLQALVQIVWSEYKNMTYVLFLVVIFLLVLFVFIFFDNSKKIPILNIFSFGANLIFANFFDLIFLLIFGLLSQLLIFLAAKRTCWSETTVPSSLTKKQHWK